MKHLATLAALAAAAVVGLAACGSGGGSPAAPPVSHSASSSAAASGTQPGGPLMAVPGYEYVGVPGGGPSAEELIKSDPVHLKSASVRMVVHDGNMIAAVAVVQLKPQYMNMPGLRQDAMSAFAEELGGSGTKLTKETIHSEPVTVARQGTSVTYAWFHGGAVTAVMGDNGPEIRDYVEAYLEAAHA